MTHARPVAVLGATGFVGHHVVRRLEREGVAVRAVGRDPVQTVAALVAALDGCGAVVNLIGIKTGDFEEAHVGIVRRMIQAAQAAGIHRLIHISVVVSRPDTASPYHDTKWRAEELIAASSLKFTILRPGVIYGEGDDMLSHLKKMIRASSIFPIINGGDARLQPVHVDDLAEAVVRALQVPESIGRRYDIVGPEPLELRAIVRRVGEALGAEPRILPVPLALMRPAVWVMTAVMKEPLSTPAQLRMLAEGMTGDPGPMERELDVHPRPFTVDGIRAVFNGAA